MKKILVMGLLCLFACSTREQRLLKAADVIVGACMENCRRLHGPQSRPLNCMIDASGISCTCSLPATPDTK